MVNTTVANSYLRPARAIVSPAASVALINIYLDSVSCGLEHLIKEKNVG